MSAAALTRYEDPRAHAVRERYLGIFGVSAEAMAWGLYNLGLVEEPPRN